jgi:hypothetical protein
MLPEIVICDFVRLNPDYTPLRDRVDGSLSVYNDYLEANSDTNTCVLSMVYTFSLRTLSLSHVHQPSFQA